MSVAQHSRLKVTSATVQPKACHSRLAAATIAANPTASHTQLIVSLAGALPKAKHSRLKITGGAGAGVVRKILTATGWLVLGVDQTTPNFPIWGPYGALGSYKPVAATAGCKDETILVSKVGDQLITTGGTSTNPKIIENWDVHGIIDVRAPYVTIRNCLVRGSATPRADGAGDTALVRFELAGSTVVGGVVEDCTLRPDAPGPHMDGIRGHDFTARRNDISGVTDGIGVMNQISGYAYPSSPQDLAMNVHIEANYIHGFCYHTDTTQGDGHTHNDGVAIASGTDIWIVGNNILGFIDPSVSNLTSPYASTGGQITGQVMLAQNTSNNIKRVHITDNWVDGGGEAGLIHALEIRGYVNSDLEVKRNQCGTNQRPIGGVKYTIRVNTIVSPVDIPATGPDANVFEVSGLPVTIVRD